MGAWSKRPVARWGLIGTVFGLATTLVVLAALGWVQARRAADGVGKARAGGMMFMARRLVALADDPQEAVSGLMGDLEARGLRYAALVGRDGDTLAEVGEAASGHARRLGFGAELPILGPAGPPPEGGLGPPGPMGPMGMMGSRGRGPRHPPKMWKVAGRYRVEALVPHPPGGRWRRRWRRARGEGAAGPPHELPPGARLVLEYEPVLAQGMVRTAGRQLAVSVAVALVLAGLGVVFWRVSLRAAAMREELARERRLAALGEMSAVLGHELRNPLASLKGHAQLVEERLEPGHRAATSAALVVTEAQRIEALTGQILEFARTGSVERRATDPRRLAREVAAGRAVVHDEAAPAEWSLDEARMRQVLDNLVDNGLKAVAEVAEGDGSEGALSAGESGVEIFVGREGGVLVFTVRDHGPGIPAGEEEALFEPFRTHRVRGTGLGLAVARRIVEAHGGRIEARSWGAAAGGGGAESDGGAEVRVWIPA